MSTEEPWSWFREIENEAPNNDYGLPESYRMEFSIQEWAKIKSAIHLMREALWFYSYWSGGLGDNPGFPKEHWRDGIFPHGYKARETLDKLSRGELE